LKFTKSPHAPCWKFILTLKIMKQILQVGSLLDIELLETHFFSILIKNQD
jgi:hypothetical protein